MWAAMIVTVASGMDYFLKGRNLFIENGPSAKQDSRE
jgi:hypothetical protein